MVNQSSLQQDRNDPQQPIPVQTGQRGGGGNFANDPERARAAGQKGGQMSGGNFANDPERAREAGRKGGQASRGGNQDNDTTH